MKREARSKLIRSRAVSAAMAPVHWFDRWLGNLLVFTGVCLIVTCALILLYQAGWWLKDGYWSPISCRTLWSAFGGTEPTTEWLGVRAILIGILDAPLSLGALVSGFGFLIAARNVS